MRYGRSIRKFVNFIFCLVLLALTSGCAEKKIDESIRVHLDSLVAALDVYKSDMGEYPPVECGLKCLKMEVGEKWRGPYVDSEEDFLDIYGNKISYQSQGDGYCLYSLGKNAIDEGGQGDDISSNGEWGEFVERYHLPIVVALVFFVGLASACIFFIKRWLAK